MSRVLRVSVLLLTGRFHGRADDDEREWPPSPLRLFQAILAGCRTGLAQREWTPARVHALEWLERRPPPTIVAPEFRRASGITIAVPNNDLDRVAHEWRRGKFDPMAAAALKTMKEISPQEAPRDEDPFVHYLWPLDEAEIEYAKEVVAASRRLLALGHGVDLAAADAAVESAPPQRLRGTRWEPSPGPGRPSRAPSADTLASLEARHEAFLARISERTINVGIPPCVHETIAYRAHGGLAPRPVACFRLFDERGRLALVPQRRLFVVAAMTRHAAIRAAEGDRRPAEWIRAFVAGHGDGAAKAERFSYLPLPSIGHAHSDGQIRRVLVAGPIAGAAETALWASERLDGRALADEKTGEVRAVLAWQQRGDAVQSLYCSRAHRWTSVTPVILPGHDDGKLAKAHRLFERALRHASLHEAVEDFELRYAPFWPGARHARDYEVPAHLAPYSRWHAAVWCRRPISGPIAIGAGRHVGLGLFAVGNHVRWDAQPRPIDGAT